MTARRAGGQPEMQLPPHERSSGEVETSRAPSYVHDARVPRPLRDRWSETHEPRVAGHSPYLDDACGAGRHLFDVIESTIVHEVGEPHTDEFVGYEYEFRARLTCVRCGRISEWEGRRTESLVGRIQVAPMVAGELVAQQVEARDSWGRDMSTWLVYRAGEQVGVIQWARGQRGRAYHVARFDAWPGGQHVEGKDPAAAFRKLARSDDQFAELAQAKAPADVDESARAGV